MKKPTRPAERGSEGAPAAALSLVETEPLSGRTSVLVSPTPGPVTALYVVGTGTELLLPAHKRESTIGRGSAPTTDLRVPVPGAKVLLRHATLTRHGHALRIRDSGSRNGCFFRERRLETFVVEAGERFAIANVTLLALDERMRALRRALLWHLGFNDHPTVDAVLDAVIANRWIAVLGSKTSELALLARALHDNHWRGAHAYLSLANVPALIEEQVDILRSGQRGTVPAGIKVVVA